MLGLDYAGNQGFTLKWSVITCLVMLVTALATGVVPFAR
jgi:CitMHS family citrate-Mg2+:H+ or citrate-Ca2+:H+ symporter